jgi:hydroxymethylpyrimidine pyrophosphatase-like HAD family hydrolase
MLPYAASLPDIRWLVSCQGGEVSDLQGTVVMATEFLPADRVAELLRVGQLLGFTPVAFGVAGVFTTSAWNADLEFYTDLDGLRPVHCPLEDLLRNEIFKAIWVGSPDDVEEHKQRRPVDFQDLQVVQTGARFLEFMPKATTKAFGLSALARYLGVRPSETLAFGDGDNDVPMFQWAGLSVAMPHGWPAALRAASKIAPDGPPETALARAIHWLFSEGLLEMPANDTVRSEFGAHSRDRGRFLLART